MKIKTSKIYLAISILMWLYVVIAELGKPNGLPYTQAMLCLGFWMLGCSFSEAETEEILLEIEDANSIKG